MNVHKYTQNNIDNEIITGYANDLTNKHILSISQHYLFSILYKNL